MNPIETYEPALLEQARKLGTSTLFEASGLSTSAVDPAIRTVWPGASVAGPAFPLECSPGDNLSIHIAMEQVPRGSVLVISTGGFVAGYWGEVLTVAAEAAGVAGLVIDGGVRDIAALTARRFPVFTRGISMRGTIKASTPSVGQPISFAGTPVAAGDLVVADDDGVLVIPVAYVETTLAQGQARADKEAQMMDALRAGRSTLELMGLTNWRNAQ
ncbi:dimethylmenaquinone methyltransferase [Burkholderia sp. BCC1993]|uniref:RraA family protein n=1 Tax=Burkholderia sp. BCC1993 TaxID=2817444 RepID=UPI002AB158ED|nr:dimethylmenaquinone methyltransferase [Burkholderia sp. BCC1993]